MPISRYTAVLLAVLLVCAGLKPNAMAAASPAGVMAPGYLVPVLAGSATTPLYTPPAAVTPLTRSATVINVVYHGFTPQSQAAFQAAVDIWAAQVISAVPITIDATWSPLTPIQVLGQCGPTSLWRDFSGAPAAGTWYASALANKLHGSDIDPTTPEMSAQFNSSRTDWYFGTDGLPPAGQIDFVSVVLHEIGHGLGFLGSANYSGGQGSWNNGGFPESFDRFVKNGSGQSLLDTALFPTPSTTLGAQFTGNNLFFTGANAVAAAGGMGAKLYAPSTWQSGSSFSHLDEATYLAGDPNSLMTPVINIREAIHDPGPITRGILQDTGWSFNTVVTTTRQPDLSIRNLADAAFVGDNIYNIDASQTKNQAVGAGITAVYVLALQNDGTATDTFSVTGDASGAGMTVHYFDAPTGGNDITAQITGAGWTPTALAAGGTCNFRAELTLDGTVVLNAFRQVRITAVSTNDTSKTDTAVAMATKAALSAVSLSATPAAPRLANTPITLTAVPTGGQNPECKFRAGYQDTAGWHWADVQGYSAARTCTWMPTTAHNYTLAAWVREVGSTANYQVFSTLTYQITATPLTAVGLAVTPQAPQLVNTPLTLSVTPTGGSTPEYKFRAGYQDAAGWHWTDLQGFSTVATCPWTPTAAHTYTLVVYAREVGSTLAYQVYTSLTYRVTAPPLSAVILSATPPAPQKINTLVTLTATPTGGANPEYKFRAGYQDATGWHWVDLSTGYSTSQTMGWTPATAHTYSLVVWAREVGSTANYQVYGTKSYSVTAQ